MKTTTSHKTRSKLRLAPLRQEQVFKPTISKDDLVSVLRCLLSDKLTESEGGGYTKTFEETFARTVRQEASLFVNNDSAAFYLVLGRLHLLPEDEVIVSPLIEPHIWEVLRCIGVKIVFCDHRSGVLGWDAKVLRSHITERTRAIILSHFFGTPHANVHTLVTMLRRDFPAIKIIEDALYGLGTSYLAGKRQHHVGGLGDVSIFSLAASRDLTSAKGAVIVATKKSDLDLLRGQYMPMTMEHENAVGLGSSAGALKAGRQVKATTTHVPDHDFKRLDFAPTEMEAALGLSQLQYLKQFAERRRTLMNAFIAALPSHGSCRVVTAEKGMSNNCFLVLHFPKGKKQAVERFMRVGITRLLLGDHTLHGFLHTRNLQEHYAMTECKEVAELHRRLLLVPVYASMKDSLAERIQAVLSSL